jgi:hypothetical protein
MTACLTKAELPLQVGRAATGDWLAKAAAEGQSDQQKKSVWRRGPALSSAGSQRAVDHFHHSEAHNERYVDVHDKIQFT